MIKTLPGFNANIEACSVEGMTPLSHLARGSSAAQPMLTLLLNYGVDTNATIIQDGVGYFDSRY